MEMPTPEPVARELRRLRILAPTEESHLESLPGNPGRLDCAERVSFRVRAGQRTLCRLTVGPGLADLTHRTRAFAEACPDIACKALFFQSSGETGYLGTEFFDGEPLDSLFRSGRLPVERAVACAGKVQAVLDGTLRPSTPTAAGQELDLFFADVLASSLFSDRDRLLLREAVFPMIRAGVLQGPSRTRWTNGDFVPPNVLVGAGDQVRLVDAEFASRTHFFAEDRWRWNAFSGLSPEGLDLPKGDEVPLLPWVEAFGILRQLVLAHRINTASFSAAVAGHFSGRLVTLASEADTPGVSVELMKAGLLPTAAPGASASSAPQCVAQVFWSSDTRHTEVNSRKVCYSFGQVEGLVFNLGSLRGPLFLRIDPGNCRASFELFSLRVRAGAHVLCDFINPAGWDKLQVARGLLRLPGAPSLHLISLDDDPILLLPAINAGHEFREIVCEVTLRAQC